MDFNFCLRQLADNARVLQHLVLGIEAEQARWKPGTEDWSVLEVINHLADEEREDFRPLFESAFTGRAKAPHDPGEWIATRGYNTRDLAASAADFMQERERSLAWLRGLKDPALEGSVVSPWEGFSAGDVLASWVAHDILHQRQLVELKWAYALEHYVPFNPGYAGDW